MDYCDLKCAYAHAPKEEMDGARSCMTFTAIWCELHKKHVMKSQPCGEKIIRPSTKLGTGRTQDTVKIGKGDGGNR